MKRPEHSPQRDIAWGRYYAQRGARVTRSDIAPTNCARHAHWARRFFNLPRDVRHAVTASPPKE